MAQLTLSKAAAVSGVPVHVLKLVIYASALSALRCGRYSLKCVELDVWLYENWQLDEP
ncbi:MAG: hypothetical protein M3R15_13135 [Acidobacteriota bacterium]|nr:hypothetical protein [Acidobacteriota bacterium]